MRRRVRSLLRPALRSSCLQSSQMSNYANYSHDASRYDSTRIPVGMNALLEMLGRSETPLAEQHLLDAGCGTGNYLQALCPHVGTATGVEINPEMLAAAQRKLGDRAQLLRGNILALPLEDDQFDAVFCSQVVHHLNAGPDRNTDPHKWETDGFPNLHQFAAEVFRVLRPGGQFVLNFSSPTQNRRTFWWVELIPAAVERVCCRVPDTEQMVEILQSAGLETEPVTIEREVLQGEAYFDRNGPFDEHWRSGDSTWSLAADAELTAGLEMLREFQRSGRDVELLEQAEQAREELGQSLFLVGRKA